MHQIGEADLFQPGSFLRICHCKVIVGIITSQCCHCQNFTCIYIHHHAKSAVLHIVTGDGMFHLLFQACLHCGIQRQDHTAAVPACDILFIGKGHIHFIVALCGYDFTGATLQKAVVGGFDSLRASVGRICKSDNLSCKAAVGIIPLAAGFQVDAGNILFINIIADLRRRLFIHSGSNLLIALGQVLSLGFDPLRIQVKDLRQGLGYFLQVRFGLL